MRHHSRTFCTISTTKCAMRSLTRVVAQAVSCASVSFDFVMDSLSSFFALTGYSTGFKDYVHA